MELIREKVLSTIDGLALMPTNATPYTHICFENTAQLALLFDPAQTFDYKTFVYNCNEFTYR